MPSIAMSSVPGIETARRIPFMAKVIGLATTPAKLLISGASAAIGPPLWPLAIFVSASRCSCEARSSRMSPTVQLPWIIGPGVWSRTAKLEPSSCVLPYRPRSTRKTRPASQKPLVGRAASPDVGQGHTESQLQASQYSPLICHCTVAMKSSRWLYILHRLGARAQRHGESGSYRDGDAQHHQRHARRPRDPLTAGKELFRRHDRGDQQNPRQPHRAGHDQHHHERPAAAQTVDRMGSAHRQAALPTLAPVAEQEAEGTAAVAQTHLLERRELKDP